MNVSSNIKIIIWGFIYLLIQVFIMRGINLGWDGAVYIQVLFYPVFLITLPFRISNNGLLLIAFVFGMILDFFYDSPGVHTAACVFTAFIRKWVISILEPRGGYGITASPTFDNMGMGWFLSYSSILVFCHILVYFCAEIFTFAYIGTILTKTIFTFLLSYVIILLFHYVISPID